MSQSLVINSIKFVAIELIGDILYFPIWWYSRGAKKFFIFFWQKIVSMQSGLGVSVWLTNIFTPMYGQADLAGRIISFFIRLFQVVIRFIILIIGSLVLTITFVIWLLLPVIVAYQIYRIAINLI